MKLDPQKLKQARINAGLSQTDAAKRLRIERESISRYESGRVPSPRYQRLHEFCTAYGCDIIDIMS